MQSVAFTTSLFDKNDSHDTKYEEYIPQNCNGIALHIKQKLPREIRNKQNLKSEKNQDRERIFSFKEHIESFRSETYFLRKEIKMKDSLISI